MTSDYDVVVIGAGLAGLTAGLFAARHGLRTVVLDRLMGGGQIINAERIENYPGFPQGISGSQLAALFQEQAMDSGVEFRFSEVTGVELSEPYRIVRTVDGDLTTKAVIIAGGSTLRKLGIPGEEEYEGRGVSHCATCDGSFYSDQVVGVVGGGDSAMDEALTLTEYASKVLLFHWGDRLDAQKVLQERVLGYDKIAVRWNTVVEGVLGTAEGVNGVRVRDVVTGETSQVDLAGLFVYIGLDPNTAYLRDVLPLDNAGHIPVNLWMETDVTGVYAAGDLRQHSAAQIVTAAGDGATAAIAAHRYLTGREWPAG